MKWLKDESYDALKQSAGNWDKLLSKVLDDNPDIKSEDITADQLLQAFERNDEAAVLQEQLTAARSDLEAKDGMIGQLEADIAELKGTPVTKKQEAKVVKEPLAEAEDVKDFAEKHEGDTLAIMAKARETGFFKHN